MKDEMCLQRQSSSGQWAPEPTLSLLYLLCSAQLPFLSKVTALALTIHISHHSHYDLIKLRISILHNTAIFRQRKSSILGMLLSPL